jgi:CO dehydrogenase/acetyl-CoA synthase beta subunit
VKQWKKEREREEEEEEEEAQKKERAFELLRLFSLPSLFSHFVPHATMLLLMRC